MGENTITVNEISRITIETPQQPQPEVDGYTYTQKLCELAKKHGKNTKIMSEEQYNQLIEQIKEINKNGKKCSLEFRRDKKYALVVMPNGQERLFYKPGLSKNQKLLMVTLEETFEIVRTTHLKLNHGGRGRMRTELQNKYYNVTTEAVCLYLSMCMGCKDKTIKNRRGKKSTLDNSEMTENNLFSQLDEDSMPDFHNDDSLETPIDTSKTTPEKIPDISYKYPELYSRAQFDLLSVTNKPDEEYKYLLAYKNYSTKLINLKALKDISVEEISESLLDIFLVFGAPNILQSKNGVDILKHICRHISTLCPDVKVVYSECVFPNSDFLGKSNEDILRKLSEWLVKTQNTKWQNGVKYVQHSLNTTFHETLCRTPSELVFGTNPNKGINSITKQTIPENIICSEDDLIQALDSKNDTIVPINNVILLSESLVPLGGVKVEIDPIDSGNEFN